MFKLRNPALGAALAALVAGTTGFCVIQTGTPDEPPLAPAFQPPTRVLPEAVIPYPLDDVE